MDPACLWRTHGDEGYGAFELSDGLSENILHPKVVIFFMTFLPQIVSADDPAVTGKLLFLGFFFIVTGMPVNALVVLAADWLTTWLQQKKRVIRAIDYSFAGVFFVFALKIFLTQARWAALSGLSLFLRLICLPGPVLDPTGRIISGEPSARRPVS